MDIRNSFFNKKSRFSNKEFNLKFNLRRICGYLCGFALFYAPLALFQKTLFYLMSGIWPKYLTVHSLCLRKQTEHLLDGRYLLRGDYFFLACFFLLLLAAFLFGPVFCGKLCPAGGFTEYISKIVPSRFKIRWSKYLDITAVRYGMLLAFMLMPFAGSTFACGFCNYFIFDLMVNYYPRSYIISLTGSLIFTLFMWLVFLGMFTEGGRGYCNFLCPVGAIQNGVHYFGRKLPFTAKMQVDKGKCIGCSKCVAVCPMDSMSLIKEGKNRKVEINVHNCIICGACRYECPVNAISYGRGPLFKSSCGGAALNSYENSCGSPLNSSKIVCGSTASKLSESSCGSTSKEDSHA